HGGPAHTLGSGAHAEVPARKLRDDGGARGGAQGQPAVRARRRHRAGARRLLQPGPRPVSPIDAVYFDGKDSLRHEVSVLIGGGRVKLVGRDVELEFAARKVRVAPRLGDPPRWLYLPGGGACVAADNDAVDHFPRERRFTKMLNRLEARPAYAVVAIALVVGLLWLLIHRGLPPAVEYVAERIPRGAEVALGEETLDALEGDWLKPTQLPRARAERLRPKLDALAKA